MDTHDIERVVDCTIRVDELIIGFNRDLSLNPQFEMELVKEAIDEINKSIKIIVQSMKGNNQELAKTVLEEI